MNSAALEGVRVIDFSQVMAGPFCTMLLGDLGADVIKVEPPAGDLSRSMGGDRLRLRGNDHAPFLALNRNKRSIALDLSTERDRAACLALLQTADVIVENFRPGVMRNLGIDYDTVNITPLLVTGQTSAVIEATTTGDVYVLGGFITSISALKPDLSTSNKTVTDLNGGALTPGDELEYAIE